MIPEQILEQESAKRGWQTLFQVEQDLLLERALISLYKNAHIRDTLLFRGGTALNKLFLEPPSRYSEDLDFVQLKPAPIKPTIDAVWHALGWLLEEASLKKPKVKIGSRGTKILYPFLNIEGNVSKLKIEINSKEHLQVDGRKKVLFSSSSAYYSGSESVSTYTLEELMATKLRAVYQRRKGRDLFDIWYVFSKRMVDIEHVVEIFHKYNSYNKTKISRKMFIKNMEGKRGRKDFKSDIIPLLSQNNTWRFEKGYQFLMEEIVPKI